MISPLDDKLAANILQITFMKKNIRVRTITLSRKHILTVYTPAQNESKIGLAGSDLGPKTRAFD